MKKMPDGKGGWRDATTEEIADFEQKQIDIAAKTAARDTGQATAATKAALREIDIASIRSLREWLVTQPGAPEFIVQHETEAKLEREKLR